MTKSKGLFLALVALFAASSCIVHVHRPHHWRHEAYGPSDMPRHHAQAWW